MSDNLRILVVDDVDENRLILTLFIQKMGHRAITANNGIEAIEAFKTESPDIILMDVMMPEMDGFEATAKIKEFSLNKWVPVIFVTALSQTENLISGLKCGGDDFLPKPINFQVLEAKIKSLERSLSFQRKMHEQNQKLTLYQEHTEGEKQTAKHVMDKLVNTEKLNDRMLKFWVNPAELFSGDVVIAARTPANTLHVLLADAAGHGLSAALTVLPIVQPFYSMTDRGFGIHAIAETLNSKIKELLPIHHFVSTTLLSVDYLNNLIQVWNGGNPPAVLMDESGNVLKEFTSKHMPLGILETKDFDSKVETYSFDCPDGKSCHLYVFSDGAVEAESSSNQFGYASITATLSQSPADSRLGHLQKAIHSHLQGNPAHDDISVAEILCTLLAYEDISPAAAVATETHAPHEAGHWQFRLTLTASELKSVDVMPLILRIINDLGLEEKHSGPTFLILSELFVNALDHGILDLDSRLKLSNMENYLEERASRLKNLEQATAEISVKQLPIDGIPHLRIHLKDSGKGFDYARFDAPSDSNTTPFGRGIMLVKTLCTKLEYVGCGNEVFAFYPLGA